MATVGLLPDLMVTRVFDALLASRVELESLLYVLPENIRASLPDARAPQQRLVQVLMCLNTYRTSAEHPPLRSFLDWAARMCGPRLEGDVLREAVSMLDDGMTVDHSPAAARQRRPWYLSMAKRLYRQQGFADIESPESTFPVFVGWSDMRARVVGVTVGDLHRTIMAVQDHVRFVRLGAFSVEGHVVFPEASPSSNEERTVVDAGLVPMRLDDLRRRAERYVRSKMAPPTDGVIARQTAWAVERCKSTGDTEALESLRDRTADGLAGLIHDVRSDRLGQALILASTIRLRAIAGSSLLTAWNEIHRQHRGRWPLYLPLERPLPIDADDLLDGVLSEQRVTSDRTVADSLLSDDESVPVICCGADVALSEVQYLLQPILRRKHRGIILASEEGPEATTSFFGSNLSSTKVFCFPADFEPGRSAAA